MTYARLLAALSLIVLAGCSSSSSSPTSSTGRGTQSRAATTGQHAGASNNGLTGFGATRRAWNAHHEADRDPKLVHGCCYGPKITTTDRQSTDTWIAVMADDVISTYIRNFPTGTSRAEALAALARDDLPPDAKLVASKVGDGCELFLYRSATLGRANPDLGNAVSFDLHSGGDETVYDPHDVAGADLSAAPDLGEC